MYAPKPAKFSPEAFASYGSLPYRDERTIKDMVHEVCQGLLHKKAGLPHTKYLGEVKGLDSKAMKGDPYLIRQSLSAYNGWDMQELEVFKGFVLGAGKEIGLWTIHNRSGGNQGVVGSDSVLIRLNPEALPTLVARYSKPDSLDLLSITLPNLPDPSYRILYARTLDKGGAECAIPLYRLVEEGKVCIKGEEGHFLIQMPEGMRNLIRDYTEGIAQGYEFLSEVSYSVLSRLIPNIPKELWERRLLKRSALREHEEELEQEEKHLVETLKRIRKFRRLSRQLKEIGGWDGLLTQMGKDMKETLALNAMAWARGVPAQVVEGSSPRLLFRQRGDAVLVQLAQDYLEGKISFPDEE